MTMPLHVVVVYEPTREGFPLPRISPNRYNRFLDVVSTFAGVRVTTVRRTLADAASEFPRAYLLLSSSRYPEDALAQCPAADRRRIAARVIGLELIAPRLGPFLELHGLLAGIDESSLHAWLRADWSGEPGIGALYGLTRIGATVGARCYPDPSAHYCRLEGPLHEAGLPHLLVDYLRAHADATRGTDQAIC